MIFYFTGTGNSLYVAKRLVSENDRLISIADCIKNDEFSFELGEGETLGIVCPVYFYSVPRFVRDFIAKLSVKNTSYVYTVFTCGGGRGEAGSMMKELLKERNIELNYVNHIVMPDNSMLFYQIPGLKDVDAKLAVADEKIANIKEEIKTLKKIRIRNTSVITVAMDLMYKKCLRTKKFYASDKCLSCGKCAAQCPERIIEMKDGRPSWTKDACGKCSACINNCPVGAIEYGRLTVKRNRYHNPKV